LKLPVVFENRADTPLAVLDTPVVFDLSELKPIAVLLFPNLIMRIIIML
jgi:hypothetical protein